MSVIAAPPLNPYVEGNENFIPAPFGTVTDDGGMIILVRGLKLGITTDQVVAVNAVSPFRFSNFTAFNFSALISTATSKGGFYTAAAKGGTAILPNTAGWGLLTGNLSQTQDNVGSMITDVFQPGPRNFYFALTSNDSSATGVTFDLLITGKFFPGTWDQVVASSTSKFQ